MGQPSLLIVQLGTHGTRPSASSVPCPATPGDNYSSIAHLRTLVLCVPPTLMAGGMNGCQLEETEVRPHWNLATTCIPPWLARPCSPTIRRLRQHSAARPARNVPYPPIPPSRSPTTTSKLTPSRSWQRRSTKLWRTHPPRRRRCAAKGWFNSSSFVWETLSVVGLLVSLGPSAPEFSRLTMYVTWLDIACMRMIGPS